MKRVWIVLVMAALVAAGIAAEAVKLPAPKAAEVEVVGVSVFKARPDDKSRSFVTGNFVGATVYFRIHSSDRFFVKLDRAACELAAFTDEKKTRLAEPGKAKNFGDTWLGSWPKISKDGRQCVFKIKSKQTPAAGATQLNIDAMIVILCGSDEQSQDTKNVALKVGEEFKLGSVPVKIAGLREGRYGKTKLMIELSSKTSFESIRKITFIGADGKEIPHERHGSSRSGFSGKMTYTRTYGLYKKADTVTAKVKYFNKVETLKVPVKTSVCLGL